MVKQDLDWVRGDTYCIDVSLSDMGGAAVSEMYFTAKVAATDAEPVFQETLDSGITQIGDTQTWRIRIPPEHTAELDAKTYVYDIEIRIGSDVYTPVMGNLRLIQDVTQHGTEGAGA